MGRNRDHLRWQNIGLVSYGCCDNVSQTRWLETTDIYSLCFGGWKYESGVSRAALLLKELVGSPSSPLPSLWWLMQFLGIPCLVARCIAPISASVFV